jgi:di/tricarboxylate transporter
MSWPQIIVISLLVLTFILLAWGKWRFDFIALGALLLGVILGVIPKDTAFDGFSHPAVITVAAVLILSRGLATSGVTDLISTFLNKFQGSFFLYLFALCFIAMVLSAFMNNVGALALLMPVALKGAKKADWSPSMILMPLAFSSVLGGLMTLIGTPPNIIVSSFRQKSFGRPFEMFDFSPVGIAVALIGVLFICLVGWRLIPASRIGRKNLHDLLEIDSYVTEVEVSEKSVLVEAAYKEVKNKAREGGVELLGLIREGQRYLVVPGNQRLKSGDLLIIEAAALDLDHFISKNKLQIQGTEEDLSLLNTLTLPDPEENLVEVVVSSGSVLVGRVVDDIEFSRRYAVTLLAVSRQGHPYKGRLCSFQIEVGDVLLLSAPTERITSLIGAFGLMPLAERRLNLGGIKNFYKAMAIFIGAIALAGFKILSAPIALTLGALLMVLTKTLAVREFYEAIDWPVLVLLGAIIPISTAFETTGAASYMVTALIGETPALGAVVLLILLLGVTMCLTDVMNNAATAIIMAPIAVSFAQKLEANPDSFLMAIAVGASCSFLTPIGHQNNALVLGPGGYKFGDYWRLGLPLEVLVLIVAVPAILWIWPLFP